MIIRLLVLMLIILAFPLWAVGQLTRQIEREKQTQAASASGRRLALVIGNAAYRHVPRLTNPVNDANDMAATLKKLGFEVIYGEDQTADQMKRLIKDFGEKLEAGGKGLFYYAGHGVQLNNKNYLIPVEVERLREQTIEFDAVDVDRVLAEMAAAGNGFNIVILDACRTNPFSRSWRTVEDGLASVNAPTGTFIAYATAPKAVASDGSGRNGLYTQELLLQLRNPGLRLEEIFKEVRKEVRKKSNNSQVPWESSSIEGEFYFAGIGNSKEANNLPKIENVKAVPLTSSELVTRWKDLYYRRDQAEAVILETTAELSLNPKNAMALRMRAPAYHANGDFEKVRLDSKAILEILKEPTNSGEFEARCYAERRLEKFDEAVLDCTKAISLDRNSSWAYYSRGSVYLDKRIYDLAIADFTQALAIDPKYQWAYNGRGWAKYEKQQYDLAVADFNKALEFDPKDVFSYLNRGVTYADQGRLDLAIADYLKVVQLEPKNASVYYARGLLYVNTGRYDLALLDYAKVIELDPKNFQLYNDRGVVYFNNGQFDLAARDYEKAIEINPKFAWPHNNLGNIYIQNEKYEAALKEYTKAIEIDSQYSMAYFNRGRAHTYMQRYDPAIKDYSNAIKLDSQYAQAYSNRAAAYWSTQQYDSALGDFAKAIELNPKDAFSYNGRAAIYDSRNQYDLAVSDYTRAIEIEPRYTVAYNNRGNLYSNNQQFSLAIEDYNKVIEIGPDDASIYNNRGFAYWKMRKYDLAIVDYTKAIELDPKFSLAYWNRAWAYDLKGKKKLARADRQKASELEQNPQP